MFYCRRWRGCWGSLMQDFIYSLFEAWEGLALLRYPPIFSMSATVLHLLIAFYFSSLSCSVSNRSWRVGNLDRLWYIRFFLFNSSLVSRPGTLSVSLLRLLMMSITLRVILLRVERLVTEDVRLGSFFSGAVAVGWVSDILYMFLMLFLYYFKSYLRLSGSQVIADSFLLSLMMFVIYFPHFTLLPLFLSLISLSSAQLLPDFLKISTLFLCLPQVPVSSLRDFLLPSLSLLNPPILCKLWVDLQCLLVAECSTSQYVSQGAMQFRQVLCRTSYSWQVGASRDSSYFCQLQERVNRFCNFCYRVDRDWEGIDDMHGGSKWGSSGIKWVSNCSWMLVWLLVEDCWWRRLWDFSFWFIWSRVWEFLYPAESRLPTNCKALSMDHLYRYMRYPHTTAEGLQTHRNPSTRSLSLADPCPLRHTMRQDQPSSWACCTNWAIFLCIYKRLSDYSKCWKLQFTVWMQVTMEGTYFWEPVGW